MGTMTQKQALAKAVKLWGKTACVRDEGKRSASSPEKRAEASKQLKALREAYPDRKARTKEQSEEIKRLEFYATHYRYAVGRVELGMFFAVKGQGDTWAEAFTKATAG
jgi:hypothetical protein